MNEYKNINVLLRSLIIIITIVVIIVGIVDYVTTLSNNCGGSQGLQISEICANNLFDVYGDVDNVDSWIELYNSTGKDICLNDYYLSDDDNDLLKSRLPDYTLGDGQYYLVYGKNSDFVKEKEDILGFRVNSDHETIYLSNNQGVVIDEIELHDLKIDETYGRSSSGDNQTGKLAYATPGLKNAEKLLIREKDDNDGGVIFSEKGGFYSDDLLLSLQSNDGVILYTTDGSTPTENSKVYTEPIKITSRENQPNRLINEKFVSINDYDFATNYGVNPVEKCTVIKARVYDNNSLSKVYSQTYWVDKTYTLPVVSLSADYEKLFSDNGIMIGGSLLKTAKRKGVKNRWFGNWIMNRRVPATVEIYESGNCILQQNASISLAGNASKTWSQMKSLNVNIEESIDASVIWEDTDKNQKISSFTLRGQCITEMEEIPHMFFRDLFVNEIIRDIDGEYYYCKPALLFINGEYWGIYTIKERKDRDYFYNHYNVQKESVEAVQIKSNIRDGLEWNVKYGTTRTAEAIMELFDEIYMRDFSNKEDYDWLINSIDISSFIDFCLTKIYCQGNTPEICNNTIMWRCINDNNDENTFCDGKWRWLGFDYDYTFANPKEDTIMLMLNYEIQEHDYKMLSLLLFQKLWKENSVFRMNFCNVLKSHLDEDLDYNTTIEKVAGIENQLEPEMGRFIEARSYQIKTFEINFLNKMLIDKDKCIIESPATYKEWIDDLDTIKRSLELRCNYLEEVSAY